MFGGKEPAVFFAGIGQIFAAIIPALIVFDVITWTDKKTAAFMFVVGVITRFLTTWFTRSSVVPIEKANEQIQEGIDSPTGTKVAEIIKKVDEQNANL